MKENATGAICNCQMNLLGIGQPKVSNKGFPWCVDREDTSAHSWIGNAAFHSSIDEPAHEGTRIVDYREFQPVRRTRLAEV